VEGVPSLMCGIVGAITLRSSGVFEGLLSTLMDVSTDRGEDSHGWREFSHDGVSLSFGNLHKYAGDRIVHYDHEGFTGVGTLRGEPATEWVGWKTATDVPPFKSPSGNWIFTHNGIISNDKWIKYAYAEGQYNPMWKPPTEIDSWAIGILLDKYGFKDAMELLQGSFAILAVNKHDPRRMWWATNYKPLYALNTGEGVLFASQRRYFDRMYDAWNAPSPIALGPYKCGNIMLSPVADGYRAIAGEADLYPAHAPTPDRTLVVCSGGLDSATCAYLHKKQYGQEVTLLHFDYNCRARGYEMKAVAELAADLRCDYRVVKTDFFERVTPSVLTNPNAALAPGEKGAELAYEWVPARNLVFMSLALAIAEKENYDCVSLGINQEEGCAFTDNEQEFAERLRSLVPFAVAPYKKIRIADPLGGLMKRQIVQVGAKLGVPHQYTYSCYAGGELHCDNCGPCHQRRIAFRMAGVADPTRYDTSTSSSVISESE
jgi:7-cyano-7-deazaguanine synthase